MQPIRVRFTSRHGPGASAESPAMTVRELTLAQLVGSEAVLRWAIHYVGIVPPRHIVNQALGRGRDQEHCQWEPFELDEAQYRELAAELVRLWDGMCIEDETLWDAPDEPVWRAAAVRRLRANPTLKPLNWTAQNEILGIPIGGQRWIPRQPLPADATFETVDRTLRPLTDFLSVLLHCVPECCGLNAFDFQRDEVLRTAEHFHLPGLVGKLDAALLELELEEDATPYVRSEFLGSRLARRELIALLEHLRDSLCEWPDA